MAEATPIRRDCPPIGLELHDQIVELNSTDAVARIYKNMKSETSLN